MKNGEKGRSFDYLVRHAPPLTVSTLLQVMAAAHWGYKVGGFAEDRGGLMIVGPPGSLKSTILGRLEHVCPHVKTLTDINAQGLVAIRNSISAGRYRTLVFPEMEKLYQRNRDTASNIEGTIQSMTAEGFLQGSFQSTHINHTPARAFVIGAMTEDVAEEHMERWEKHGFNRRFLWVTLQFDNDKLERAFMEWKRLPMEVPRVMAPNGRIPMIKSVRMGRDMITLCSAQPSSNLILQASILRRIYAVLAWQLGARKNPQAAAWRMLLSFAQALGKQGTQFTL